MSDDVNLIAARGDITPEQYDVLLRPLRASRVSTRRQGGKNLSYVEAWEIKAHLTRIFGFGRWDSEMLEYHFMTAREYPEIKEGEETGKQMVEVIYSCRIQLTVHDYKGIPICRHTEAAVGSTSGPLNMLGEHHDNALKTAASDALKRCAINLGTQFGLSLYDDGTKADVIKTTIVKPEGWVEPEKTEHEKQAEENIAKSLGAQEVQEEVADPPAEPEPSGDEPPMFDHTRRRMFALFAQKGIEEGEQLERINKALGTSYESRADLTQAHALEICEKVAKLPDAGSAD